MGKRREKFEEPRGKPSRRTTPQPQVIDYPEDYDYDYDYPDYEDDYYYYEDEEPLPSGFTPALISWTRQRSSQAWTPIKNSLSHHQDLMQEPCRWRLGPTSRSASSLLLDPRRRRVGAR